MMQPAQSNDIPTPELSFSQILYRMLGELRIFNNAYQEAIPDIVVKTFAHVLRMIVLDSSISNAEKLDMTKTFSELCRESGDRFLLVRVFGILRKEKDVIAVIGELYPLDDDTPTFSTITITHV